MPILGFRKREHSLLEEVVMEELETFSFFVGWFAGIVVWVLSCKAGERWAAWRRK